MNNWVVMGCIIFLYFHESCDEFVLISCSSCCCYFRYEIIYESMFFLGSEFMLLLC